MWMITSASDRFIVAAYAGTAENGLYAAAYKLPTLISLAGGVFIEAWQFSSVSDARPEERSKFFGTVYKYYVSIMFIGTAVLIAGSKILTSLLLDESYYSSWQYVPVLALAMIFSALSAFMGSVYFLEKRSMRSMITAAMGATVNVLLNFLLIPTEGAMGAAIATAISYVAVYMIRAYDTGRYLRFGLCNARVIINTVLLTVGALIMILEPPFWICWQIGIILAVLAINGRDILKAVLDFLRIFSKKSKNI
jgi:O-antigen/teichoic acid export membrane protein